MSAPSLIERFNLRLPVVQAPMAGGVTTPELVSEVCKAGALGFIGAGLMPPQTIAEHAAAIRQRTDKPFGINLFVQYFREPPNQIADPIPRWLADIYHKRGLPLPKQHQPTPLFEDQLDAVLSIQPAVASFAFGLLRPEHIRALKERRIAIVGTANHAEEAKHWEDIGADAVCVQGSDAGGHRGGFTEQYIEQPMGLQPLMTQCRQNVRVPLWAAGGLMTGQSIAAVRNLGAEAAQMGTAFLSTRESGIPRAYKNALLDIRRAVTAHTKLFSGRPGRALVNRFIRENMMYEQHVAAYPLQRAYTAPLLAYAEENGDPDYMALWAGRGVGLCRDVSVSELMDILEEQYNEAIGKSRNEG